MMASDQRVDVAALLGVAELPPAPQGAEDVAGARVVGQRIAEARRRKRMSAKDLAGQVGLSPDKLSKVESGVRQVAAVEAPRFARALGVTVAYLFRGEGAQPALALRLMNPALPEQLSPARRRAAEVLEVEARLVSKGLTQVPPSPDLATVRQYTARLVPARTREEAQRQGRKLAEMVREHLGWGLAPIGDLPSLIEESFGANVVLGPFGGPVAGLCAQVDDQALLLANTSFTGGNVRFTTAHELGHFLCADAGEVIEESSNELVSNAYVERRASAFAAHVLLPVEGVERVCAAFGLDKGNLGDTGPTNGLAIATLMATFGASLECVVHHLREMGWLSWEQSRTLTRRSARELLLEIEPSIEVDWSLVEGRRHTRVPVRLLTAARAGAKTGAVGTATLAKLLNRPDDDALFEQYVGYRDEDEDNGENPQEEVGEDDLQDLEIVFGR